MIMKKDDFYNKIAEYELEMKEGYRDLIVIMSYGYTQKEAEESDYELQFLEFDGMAMCHCWINDWDEGQEYIDFYGIYTDNEVIKRIIDYDTERGLYK